MKIKKLLIENFLVLTSADIDMADRGLVLIQGLNAADSSANSNGAGKSSIADALCWAIYGTTARGESGDAVVNTKAGKNTRVEVIVEDDGVQYHIVRHRKHKTGKNGLQVKAVDGWGEKDITKGTDKLTQEVVNKIVGASHEVFTGSIYAGQEAMPDLPSLTDKMLKVLIEEAAGVNALEAAYKKAREKATAVKADYDRSVQAKDGLELRHTAAVQQLTDLEAADAVWTSERDARVLAIDTNIRSVLIPKAQALAAEAPPTEIARVQGEIEAIDKKIAAVGAEATELRRLTTNQIKAQSDVGRLENDLKRAAAAIETARRQVAAAEHKVGCPCDSCGRALTETELGAVVAASKKAVDDALAAELALHDTWNSAMTAAHEAEKAVNAFKLGMTDVSAEVSLRSSLQAQLNALVAKDTERKQLIARAQTDMATMKAEREAVSPFTPRVDAAKTNIENCRKLVVAAEAEVKRLQSVLEVEQEVVKVFAPAGVRARVLDEVTPYLNGQTSKYLSILSDGNITAEWSTLSMNKSGDVKERFAIDVSSSISAKTFKGLSGGEKRKVRVATALALQDLVSTRAAKPIELFIGDEIDDALDASGLERLMVILDEKAKERGSVFVISHNSLRDEISQVLTVERSAGGDTKIVETVS